MLHSYQSGAQERRRSISLDEVVSICRSKSQIGMLNHLLKSDFHHLKHRINAQDKSGELALVAACRAQNVKAIKALIENGADPYAENKEGRNAYSIVTSFEGEVREEIFALLDNSPLISNVGDVLLEGIENLKCK